MKRFRERLGKLLFRLARRVIKGSRSTEVCWICGSHPGMGPFWNGAITCWECHSRWSWANRPKDGFSVDPKGLGRYVGEPKP